MSKIRLFSYNHPDEQQPLCDADDILENVMMRRNFTVETRENMAEALRRIVRRELALERAGLG